MKKFGEIEAKYLKISWSGVDLLVFLSLVRSTPLFLARSWGREHGKQNERERKKREYLIGLRINSSSTVWASYCTKAWELWPFVKANVCCFCEFVAIFWVFIRFDAANANALLDSPQSRECLFTTTYCIPTRIQQLVNS